MRRKYSGFARPTLRDALTESGLVGPQFALFLSGGDPLAEMKRAGATITQGPSTTVDNAPVQTFIGTSVYRTTVSAPEEMRSVTLAYDANGLLRHLMLSLLLLV